MSFYNNNQNPSVCCFLVQIGAIVSSVEFSNLNKKAQTKWILVVVVNCRHRENGLFLINFLESFLDFIITGILIFLFYNIFIPGCSS